MPLPGYQLNTVHALSIGMHNRNNHAWKGCFHRPPYYDNIGYADLSDFFYVWLRKSLKPIFLGFCTPRWPSQGRGTGRHALPPRRQGEGRSFFLDGMTRAIHNLAEQAHPGLPGDDLLRLQAGETKGRGHLSTGWETFLDAVIRAGFALTGTWPMRTE